MISRTVIEAATSKRPRRLRSYKPNLLVGDFLFVSKWDYGYSRYSFPFGIPPFKGKIFESNPERGDIIVFKLPGQENINYVKIIR